MRLGVHAFFIVLTMVLLAPDFPDSRVSALGSGDHRIGSGQSANSPPPISGQVTFLYYNDLEKAADFYGRILGLKSTLDLTWVKIYQLSPTSSIGLVDATSGAHRPSSEKPVMVSLVVDDVDRWYEYLKNRGVEIAKPPHDSSRINVRTFSFQDREGYSLEVFSWRTPAAR